MRGAAVSTGCGAGGRHLTPGERRRLVAPDGGSCLLAVRTGGPFTAWATVFERASARIRRRFEPRFPHVNPHRLRHSSPWGPWSAWSAALPAGCRAGDATTGTGPDAALALYLAKADPMMVLRDLLVTPSVLTTENTFGAWTRPGFTARPTGRPGAPAGYSLTRRLTRGGRRVRRRDRRR